MDQDRKFFIIKVSSLIAGIIMILIWGGIQYMHYRDIHMPGDSLQEMKQHITGDEQASSSSSHIITMDQIKKQKPGEVPLDNKEVEFDSNTLAIMKDKDQFTKYIFALAMLGKKDLFYQQFDPNQVIRDFPNVKTAAQEQDQVLKQITHNGTLQSIRIVDETDLIKEKKTRMTVQLIYADNTRKQVQLDLAPMADEHTNISTWVVSSSVKDLLN